MDRPAVNARRAADSPPHRDIPSGIALIENPENAFGKPCPPNQHLGSNLLRFGFSFRYFFNAVETEDGLIDPALIGLDLGFDLGLLTVG
jgi:hypothetical protein